MESGRPSARCSDEVPSETQGSSLGGTFLRGNDKPGLLRSQAGDEPQEERLRNLGVQSREERALSSYSRRADVKTSCAG